MTNDSPGLPLRGRNCSIQSTNLASSYVVSIKRAAVGTCLAAVARVVGPEPRAASRKVVGPIWEARSWICLKAAAHDL